MTAPADLASFRSLVRERCGLSPDAYRADTLDDAIRGRMTQRGISSPVDYYMYLTQDITELQAFAGLLTVNETYFMRESVHFDLLADKLLREMLASRAPEAPIRILIAGCSTGEEPYSLKITLLERYGKAIRSLISIIGVDIDCEALARAERGEYGGMSFRVLPEALRQKYFEPLGGNQHRIKDSVREGVRFISLNLAAEEYPAFLLDLDVIFYRNVSIYFDPPTQSRIFTRLAGLLKRGGWLFVSSTETLTHDNGVLALFEVDGVFCYRKSEGIAFGDRRNASVPAVKAPAATSTGRTSDPVRETPAEPPARPAAPPLASGQPAHPPTRIKRPGFDDALALASQKRYDEALDNIDRFLLAEPSLVKGYMLKAGILVNLRRNDEASRACLSGLERDRWCLEGHLLLGLMARMGDDEDEAMKRFREAVYIQPSCWLAHFHLAQIHATRQDVTSARREYEVVVRLLDKGSLSDHGLTFFPLAFPAEQIMHLCRHNLAKLGPARA